MAAFERDMAERAAGEFSALIRTAHPGIVSVMPDAELLARTRAGVELCCRHAIASRRDILILCLVHVLYGTDPVSQPGLSWIGSILAEGTPADSTEPDTRAYRIHCRLSES
ncbi:MAG: hypothetical protein ACK40C_06820 [Novosphingobium meiothermophilum]